MQKMDTFYTPAQVAEALQINVLTVYHYIRTGEIQAIHLGRYYRIRKNDFDNFLKSHKKI